MSEYGVQVTWKRETPDFTYDGYDRTHWWQFGSGTRVQASSAPEYRGDPALVNPEEAFAAAVSSCHMLTFLALAARQRYVVDVYEDDATALMGKNAQGRLAVTKVTLRPRIVFGGDRQPTAGDVAALHEKSHTQCFIANSVLTEVTVESR